MKVALFGGTFDPVHRGHLAVARAAARRFALDQIHFVPTDAPPHRRNRPLTPYYHRFAMLALATAGEKKFVPSPLEARAGEKARGFNYSIDTVRRMKRRLTRGDRLYFLIGADAFREIATWRQPEALLAECDFIVASRPGFSVIDVLGALPIKIQKEVASQALAGRSAPGSIRLGRTTLYLLDGVRVPVSATAVRAVASEGRPLKKLVAPDVGDYILKTGLYQRGSGVG
ncbi:MAG: nicotinate-nucleotide adenylyltransferase [Terriglobales bacterium]